MGSRRRSNRGGIGAGAISLAWNKTGLLTGGAVLGSRHRTGRIARFVARIGNTIRRRQPPRVPRIGLDPTVVSPGAIWRQSIGSLASMSRSKRPWGFICQSPYPLTCLIAGTGCVTTIKDRWHRSSTPRVWFHRSVKDRMQPSTLIPNSFLTNQYAPTKEEGMERLTGPKRATKDRQNQSAGNSRYLRVKGRKASCTTARKLPKDNV